MTDPAIPWQEEQLAVALRKANVYIDLSGWLPKYFRPLLNHYRQREQLTGEWQESGGKVADYIGVDVLEELFIAAGFFPLRITGDPAGSMALVDKYVGAAFNPMVHSMFNWVLDGTYAFLDHLIISNSSEAVLRLFYCLREIKRLEPYPGDFYFFGFLHTKFRAKFG